jgi:hypothetical protein
MARFVWRLPALHFKVRQSPAYFGAHAIACVSVFIILWHASFTALKPETLSGARVIYHWDGFLAHVFGIKITSPRALRGTGVEFLMIGVLNILAELTRTTSAMQRGVALLFNILIEAWLCSEAFYFRSVSGGFILMVLVVLFLFAFLTVERGDIDAPKGSLIADGARRSDAADGKDDKRTASADRSAENALGDANVKDQAHTDTDTDDTDAETDGTRSAWGDEIHSRSAWANAGSESKSSVRARVRQPPGTICCVRVS